MAYSSDLSDAEWAVLEPVLKESLPVKKETRPSNWTRRELLNGMLYQLKSGCNWGDLPRDFPPYSTVYWHYKQWRDAGVFDRLLEVLHGQLRVKVKKKVVGQP
jgi:transposase